MLIYYDFYPVLLQKYVESLCTSNGLLEYTKLLEISFFPTVHIVWNKVCSGWAINLINFSVASKVGST